MSGRVSEQPHPPAPWPSLAPSPSGSTSRACGSLTPPSPLSVACTLSTKETERSHFFLGHGSLEPLLPTAGPKCSAVSAQMPSWRALARDHRQAPDSAETPAHRSVGHLCPVRSPRHCCRGALCPEGPLHDLWRVFSSAPGAPRMHAYIPQWNAFIQAPPATPLDVPS